MSDTHQNIVLYFFSASAQVWAALVAFGGMAIRDRVLRLDSSLDQFFGCLTNQIRPICPLFSNRQANDPIFINRNSLTDFLIAQGDFNSIISDYEQRRNKAFYGYRWGERNGQSMEAPDVMRRIEHARTYLDGYLSANVQLILLSHQLIILLWGGLALIILPLIGICLTDCLSENWTLFWSTVILYLGASVWVFKHFVSAFRFLK